MHIFSNKATCTFQARLESQQQLKSLLTSPSERGLGQQQSDGQSRPGWGPTEERFKYRFKSQMFKVAYWEIQ